MIERLDELYMVVVEDSDGTIIKMSELYRIYNDAADEKECQEAYFYDDIVNIVCKQVL